MKHDLQLMVEAIAEERGRCVAEERERCARLVEKFAENYPTDIFPEVTRWTVGASSDAIAASMARHLCRVLGEEIRKEPEE